MSGSAATEPPFEPDALRAGEILLDVSSFADAATWREPDPIPNPFAALSATT
ncbi:MAG: hypothetical protein WBZ04_07635 [Candidatus Nanopelagicales bacterium]